MHIDIHVRVSYVQVGDSFIKVVEREEELGLL
jgi:hypothetical protein